MPIQLAVRIIEGSAEELELIAHNISNEYDLYSLTKSNLIQEVHIDSLVRGKPEVIYAAVFKRIEA